MALRRSVQFLNYDYDWIIPGLDANPYQGLTSPVDCLFNSTVHHLARQFSPTSFR